MGTLPKPETQQMSGGQTPANLDRKQFADLDMESAEMTYTFAHGSDPKAMKGSPNSRNIGQPIKIKGQNTGDSSN